MDNVELSVEDHKLAIVVDLTQELEETKSGKSVSVATTHGNVTVPGTQGKIRLGLNVFKKKE